ncbi:MAG: sigma-70 family RNA polymerase sigma factor [Deltaproteobacteria bacterium]|jgi:RNA polymerase sigma-70 factor (ECF subfamily)
MGSMSAEAVRPAVEPVLDVSEIYRAHGDFVYRALSRFGVPERDLPDQLHEVFVVVHRRLGEYRHDAAMTTWLFAIARRVAAGYRRRAFRVREQIEAEPHADRVCDDDPEQNTERARAREQMESILNRMTLDQRAVFVMFEIDGMTGSEIASLMDCPLQTVFSRLRRARETFERNVARLRATEERRAG